MLVRVDHSGRVAEGGEFLPSSGILARGSIRGRVDPETLCVSAWSPTEAEVLALDDRRALLIHGEVTLWRVAEDRLVYAAPDLSGVYDVFYARQGEHWLLSDSLFELASMLEGGLSLDRGAVEYFVPHGYFTGDATFFREIRRIPAGQRLLFGGKQPLLENQFDLMPGQAGDQPRSYEQFKRIVESVCTVERPGGGDVILLSGGLDSALLAAVLAQYAGDTIRTATFRFSPERSSNLTDLDVATALAGHLGLRHTAVEVNIGELTAGSLDALINDMPMAAHMAIHMQEGMRRLKEDGAQRTWCGQNADSIYNLGPTSSLTRGQGKIDLIKRLYLSRPFIASLDDVKGGSVATAASLAGRIGAQLAKRFYKGRDLRLPRNSNELIHAFVHAEDYMALRPANEPPMEGSAEPVSTGTIRKLLFDQKISSFLAGRDSRIMFYGPRSQGLIPVNPFSASAMLLYFRELEMGWRDVLNPKRYIRDFVRERIGRSLFNGLYGRFAHRREAPGIRKSADWMKRVLNDSRYGIEILEALSDLSEPWAGYRDSGKLQYCVSLYWAKSVCERSGLREALQAVNHPH